MENVIVNWDTISTHKQDVVLSPNARCYDYEAELIVVIGKTGIDIPLEKAKKYIFGYTCGNDLSARDAQFVSKQRLIGKTFPVHETDRLCNQVIPQI